MTDPNRIAPFFWLHVKKSAGGFVRRALGDHYINAPRVKQPVSFIQSPRGQWNDVLNNYRVPLGAYQFRRCQFAQRFLYPDDWDRLVKFAFARDPLDRALSMFFYLAKRRVDQRSFLDFLADQGRDVPGDASGQFSLFLGLVERARASDSIYRPVDNHFTTHTAPMAPDVTDDAGRLLLDHVIRTEDTSVGLQAILRRCGLPDDLAQTAPHNVNKDRADLTPTPGQIRRIEQIYAADYELYETASRPADIA